MTLPSHLTTPIHLPLSLSLSPRPLERGFQVWSHYYYYYYYVPHRHHHHHHNNHYSSNKNFIMLLLQATTWWWCSPPGSMPTKNRLSLPLDIHVVHANASSKWSWRSALFIHPSTITWIEMQEDNNTTSIFLACVLEAHWHKKHKKKCWKPSPQLPYH